MIATPIQPRVFDPAPEVPAQPLASRNTNPTDQIPNFIDLGALIEAGLPQELPTVASIFAGKALLYAGRVNEVHGEPGLGKTNVSYALAVSVIQHGGDVLFLDPEDTPRGIAKRLSSFGLSAEEVTRHFHYLHNPEPADYSAIQEWNRQRLCDLVICDGLAEMLAQESLSEDAPRDVLPFFRRSIRPFSDAGSAVLVSDHVVKSPENRGLWPRGSGAKMGRYDGAVYLLEEIEPYSPERAGAIRLRVAKDRSGGVGVKNQSVAELHLIPSDDSTRLEWKPPGDRADFMPTVLMEKISQRLTADPSATKRELRTLGNSEYVDRAIVKLVDLGHLRIESQGPGKKTIYHLLKPFSEGIE